VKLGELPFAVAASTPVSGGNLNAAFRAELEDGRVLFVKTADDAVDGAFIAEAAALEWIAAADGAPPVPEVVAAGAHFLALEWVKPPPRDDVAFGRGLAALHRSGADGFGALPPGVSGGLRIGPVLLPVSVAGNWAEVYCDQIVLSLTRDAVEAGALTAAGAAAVTRVCDRFESLAGPLEAPARLHGDLWGGNAMGGYLIDPASYGGHREVDLAMMALFGGFSDTCFRAYDDAFPLADGWRERIGLWQLFPLLLHAVLYGGGYGAQVEATARRCL
jgi:fructosamine-3-kinase